MSVTELPKVRHEVQSDPSGSASLSFNETEPRTVREGGGYLTTVAQ
jgi:hypothetical protein